MQFFICILYLYTAMLARACACVCVRARAHLRVRVRVRVGGRGDIYFFLNAQSTQQTSNIQMPYLDMTRRYNVDIIRVYLSMYITSVFSLVNIKFINSLLEIRNKITSRIINFQFG